MPGSVLPVVSNEEASGRIRREALPDFGALAAVHFDSLYNFACWMTRNPHDAEDFVQDTYVKALRAASSFQPGTNLKAWMFRILKNTILSARSKLDWRMTVAMEAEEDWPVPVTSETPESSLVQRSAEDAMRRVIEQLPANYREVLLLCDVEEASYREIADILSIPIGTVMSRLARARKKIRLALGNESKSNANHDNTNQISEASGKK